MIICLEIHCDHGIENNVDCANMTHEYGSCLAGSVQNAYTYAAKDASRRGWMRRGNNWYCPSCRKLM